MDFMSDECMSMLKKARAHLIACKSCSMCENSADKFNYDELKVKTYFEKYQKDVTRKTGFMCDNFCVRKRK